jgi:NAD(P)-dependent dehydrogenase (short-subunit alcohol dehydrogenase family)
MDLIPQLSAARYDRDWIPESRMRFDQKVIIVTGGANGIGRAAVRLFAREGGRVVIGDIDDVRGSALQQELLEAGTKAYYVRLDVTDATAVETAMKQIMAEHHRIDVLYNNAGGSSRADGPAAALTQDAFMHTMQLNLFGTWLASKYVIPHMAACGGGAIVNTVSSVARVALPGLTAYTAAKGAIDALTRAMAVDYAADRIRVNALMPALTRSERVQEAAVKDPSLRTWTGRHLFGLLEPEQVARVALFLASDDADGMTGETVIVDSGATIAGVARMAT